MSTTTTNYGLIKPGTDDPILVGQLNDNMDTIDTVLKDHSDKIDAAALGIKYKGEVNYYADLPNSAEIGDAYTVKYAGSSGTTPDGTEYVWGTVSGTNQWINFSKDSYTKAEVDALLALKQNALSSTQLDAVNSGIDSTKVEQIETNKNNILTLEAMNGAKNLAPYNSGEYTGAAGFWFIHTNCIDIAAGTSVYIVFDYTITSGQYSIQLTDENNSVMVATTVYTSSNMTSGHKAVKVTVPTNKTAKGYNSYLNQNATVTVSNFMIVPAEIYEAGFTDYQPYAMSNAELTAAIQAIQAQLANQ